MDSDAIASGLGALDEPLSTPLEVNRPSLPNIAMLKRLMSQFATLQTSSELSHDLCMDVNEATFESWINADYPRPQLCRRGWVSLNGQWEFALDSEDSGLGARWFDGKPSTRSPFDLDIEVPFPPGSPKSGVLTDNPLDVPDVVWYRRTISASELDSLEAGFGLYVNFEGVDFQADVWVDGEYRCQHVGGYTPFSVLLGTDRDREYTLVVRAQDDQTDTSQPRGKQAWRDQPDGIWYHRSNGIWRDVWAEARPRVAIEGFNWETDLDKGALRGEVAFSGDAPKGSSLKVVLSKHGRPVVEVTGSVSGYSGQVLLDLPAIKNRMDWSDWLWSPEHPNLLDVQVKLNAGGEEDLVVSYVGLRTVSLSERYFLLNRLPVYLRGVLDQGYWEESFFTAPSGTALRRELELVQELGFNFSRVHERSADRRYLAWADILGVLVWVESASTYSFDERAIRSVVSEWLDLVIRDRAHPSVICWVPFNESWGVAEIASDPRQRAFVDSVVSLTRALDQSRPVSANDGWEQLDTDIVTTHDYGSTEVELRVNYQDKDSLAQTVNGIGPQGRRTLLREPWTDDRPVILSEFGGISLDEDSAGAWGYSSVPSPGEYQERLQQLFAAVLESPVLAGFCYTQLTDTGLEVNGLCTANRVPKIPAAEIRQIVADTELQNQQIRPRVITQVATQGESK